MFEIVNQTRYEAALSLHLDREGREWVAATIKATFAVVDGRRLVPSEVQEPILHADEYTGDPGVSSLAMPADVAPFKPATDVILVGHAYAPGRKPTRVVDVSLEVGPVKKTARVFGDRVWKRGIFGYKPSRPRPFERMPLVYEKAFGGTDPNAEPVAWDSRNPVGVGFCARRNRRLAGRVLPNIEAPNALIRRWRDRPTPQGLAAIDRSWDARRTFAGSYDETWMSERAPLLPADFDYRFHQVAHPDLIARGYLKGDEPVRLINATPDEQWSFSLPGRAIGVAVRANRSNTGFVANLTSVLLVPDEQRLMLVWTQMIPVQKKLVDIRRVTVFALPLFAVAELSLDEAEVGAPLAVGV